MNPTGGIAWLIVAGVAFGFLLLAYFLPWYVARRRRHR